MVSLIQLTAVPDVYHGKTIVAVGFLSLEFEYQDIRNSQASWRAAEIQWKGVLEYWPEELDEV